MQNTSYQLAMKYVVCVYKSIFSECIFFSNTKIDNSHIDILKI